jgi:glycosyltransferase involved in cell wall biosynthesis
VRRGRVDYHFVSDGGPSFPSARFFGQRVARAIAGLSPTVIHVDGLVFPVLVRHLRLMLSKHTAILVQDHGGIHAQSSLFQSRRARLLYRLGLRAADGFLFTAREQAVPWQRAGIIGRAQTIHEIPEGSSDLGLTVTSVDRPLPGRPALLWVGRLDANKDPLTVLDGFERAATALPEAAMTFVFSEDQLLPEVRFRIEHSAVLRPRVHLLGRVERGPLRSLYAGADLFVLGSHHEGSGYALIEALSFGVTPVVADIPSFRKLTDGGRLGALFPPGNAVELARALRELGGADLGARRQHVCAYFERELSWSAVGRRAFDIYCAAAMARGSSP